MPGKSVKNWKQYEKLRKKGYSKERAARITNASEQERQEKRRRTRKPR